MLIKIYKNHSPTIIYQELLDLQLFLIADLQNYFMVLNMTMLKNLCMDP